MLSATATRSDPYRFCRLFPWMNLTPLHELEEGDTSVPPYRRPPLLSGTDILGRDWAVQPVLVACVAADYRLGGRG